MDHSYPGGAEETDFAWRAQESGACVVTCPGAVVHYRLKDAPGPLFRQQRIQNYARILLWMRYRHVGMTGPSVRYSVTSIIRQLPRWVLRRGRGELLLSARLLGGHVGALQGVVDFRIRGRVPTSRVIGTCTRPVGKGLSARLRILRDVLRRAGS